MGNGRDMAHKAKVIVTDEWQDISGLIEGYNSIYDYKIQLLSSGKAGYSFLNKEPDEESWTVIKQYGLFVYRGGQGIGCYVRAIDCERCVLSIEETIGTPIGTEYIWIGGVDGDLDNPLNYEPNGIPE
jgi:hypothetical protein